MEISQERFEYEKTKSGKLAKKIQSLLCESKEDIPVTVDALMLLLASSTGYLVSTASKEKGDEIIKMYVNMFEELCKESRDHHL